MDLRELEVYQLAREISGDAWGFYKGLDWQTKKIIGDQFVAAADSIGANIAEGFGRFHYLDRNRFNYQARGSLLETLHWLDLLAERKLIPDASYKTTQRKLRKLMVKLNNYITATKGIAQDQRKLEKRHRENR